MPVAPVLRDAQAHQGEREERRPQALGQRTEIVEYSPIPPQGAHGEARRLQQPREQDRQMRRVPGQDPAKATAAAMRTLSRLFAR